MKKIIIGTWPLSGDYGYVPLSQIHKTLSYSFENKFYEYDTAPSYGNGFIEFILGNFFNGEKKIKFNTKVGNHPFFGKSFSLSDIEKSIEQSLKRLKTLKINVLFLHNPRLQEKELEKIIIFLNNLKKNRVINYTGISLPKNFELDNKILEHFDVIQDDASLLSTNFTNYNLKKKQKFHGRSPFANGILTGSINKKFKKDDHRNDWLSSTKRKKIINHSIKKIEELSNYKLIELAYKFVNFQSNIDKNIFGVKNVNHIKNLVKFKKLKIKQKDKLIFDQVIKLNASCFNIEKKYQKYLY